MWSWKEVRAQIHHDGIQTTSRAFITGTPAGLANGCASRAGNTLKSYVQNNAEHTRSFPPILMYSFVFPALPHLACN